MQNHLPYDHFGSCTFGEAVVKAAVVVGDVVEKRAPHSEVSTWNGSYAIEVDSDWAE